MEVEKNRAIIVPTAQHTPTTKPLGSATRFDWVKYPTQPPPHPVVGESESRASYSEGNASRKTVLCYRLADLVMVMCIIFPLTIAFWRGVWELMDYHSKQWGIDPWLSMGVGYSIPFLLHLFQEPLKRTVCFEKMNFVLFYLLSRTILLVHSFGSVNQWRGLWAWMDIELGTEPWSAAMMMVVGIFFAIITKTLNNVLAPPLVCIVDENKSIHDCSLRFKTSKILWIWHPKYVLVGSQPQLHLNKLRLSGAHKKPYQYFLDCFFSVIVIPGFVVFCWRGLWTLADIYLFAEDEIKSAMASLCFGYFICVLLCLCQPGISQKVRNLKGIPRLIFIDSVYLFGFFGCVLAWRGVWNSYNIFFVFENPNTSKWITTVAGALGTMILGCISTVVVRGIAIDGDMAEGNTAEWLISYISVLDTPIYDVPYPEPWVCRYFCTSQKIGLSRKRRQKIVDSQLNPNLVGDKSLTKPLKIVNSLPNSAQPNPSADDLINKNSQQHPPKNNRFRLSDLPNIDSSSEEELGMRTTMMPSPSPDDVVEDV